MKMKHFLLSILLLVATNAIIAQHVFTLKGQLKDSVSAKALSYASVSLQEAATGKAIAGALTGLNGQFKLDSIPAGNYNLSIEYLGYRSLTLSNVNIDGKSSLPDLKNILMVPEAKMLSGVVVTAQGKLIENKIDKLVFNAERDLTSQGGVATDILKKVPQVSVDVDGNVELAGSTSIRFLINGKPSTIFGSNIADVLQAIPASQIKSIEVITNPGAKYDAQGLGGIINIILKTNAARGINGNLSLTGGTRVENGSLNFNARNKHFGLNAFVSSNARLPVNTPQTSSRLSVDSASQSKSALDIDGANRVKRFGLESGLGLDWTMDKYNSITGSFNYNTFKNSFVGSSAQRLGVTDFSGNSLSNIFSDNFTSTHTRFHNADASLNYKRTFDKEDQELNILINTSFGNSFGEPSNYQTLPPKDSIFYGIIASNPGKENETQVQVDYTQPLKKNTLLGVGGKLTWLDINSFSAVNAYNTSSKDYHYNASLSNALDYHQKVYALYAELSFPVKNYFDAKLGGRYERTQINAFYSNAQSQAQIPGYNTWVPSIFLSKKLGDKQIIKLSYAKRIERPDYGDLNPFVNTSDPKNITAGNPYLLPEIGHRVELSYSRDITGVGSFMVTAFYRRNGQDIQPYTKFYAMLPVGDSVYYNVSVSTRENIGTEKNTGFSLFASVNATSKLNLRANVFAFHRHIINVIDPGSDRSSFNYRLNINAAYQFTPLLAAEFFGNFNSARNEVQGKYPSFTTYSFALRKLFWNKKASIALTTVNPFNEYVNQRLEIYGTNFTQTSLRKIPFRSFGINFTWKFGKLAFKKDQQQDNAPDLNPQ